MQTLTDTDRQTWARQRLTARAAKGSMRYEKIAGQTFVLKRCSGSLFQLVGIKPTEVQRTTNRAAGKRVKPSVQQLLEKYGI